MTSSSSSPTSVEDVRGILDEVHAQIELERAKRIQLEAEVEKARQIQLAQALERERKLRSSPSSPQTSHSSAINDKDYMSLQAEVEGYRQLVEVLTKERHPAIKAAHLRERRLSGSRPILPLPLVRLLELIPWHPYAEERVDVEDTVYEWQCFDPLLKDWRGDLPSFPDFFHALPVTASPHGDDGDIDLMEEDIIGSSDDEEEAEESISTCDDAADDDTTTWDNNIWVSQRGISLQRRNSLGGNCSSSSNNSPFDFPNFLSGLLSNKPQTNDDSNDNDLVLTNANLTQRFVLNKEGYPLPNPAVSGSWSWMGRWTVDRPGQSDSSEEPQQEEKQLLCDREGWTYAREASHFVLWNAKELCGGDGSAFCSCSCSCSAPQNNENTCILKEEEEEEETEHTTSTACLQCQQRRRQPVLRRRKWIRQRVLVDYPLASESSREFLRLAASNAGLKLAAQELSQRFEQVAINNQRVQQHWETTHHTHQVQLEHYQTTWQHHEERIQQLRYGKFKRKIEELACNQDDILPIIANPDLFGQLQRALRQSGAITNVMLQQGIHFYILDHVRPVHGKSERRRPVPAIIDDDNNDIAPSRRITST